MKPNRIDGPGTTSVPAQRQLLQGLAYGTFAVFVWGSYLAVSRAGVTAAGLMPWDFALFRFLPAGLLGLLVFVVSRRVRTAAAQIGPLRVCALTLCGGPLFIVCATAGYLYAPLPHGAVIQPGSAVIAGLLLARAFAGSQGVQTNWPGALLVLAGLALANAGDTSGRFDAAWRGDLLFVMAGALWAGFTVLLKRWQVDPISGTCIVSVLSLAITLPLYGALEGFARMAALPSSQLALQFTMQGVLAGFLAVFAFVKAVQLLGASRASLLPALVPMCAIAVGVPLTGEVPSALQGMGLVTVTIGLLLALGITGSLRLASRRS